MPDYKAMYFRMFNKVTDAIELLRQAQIDGEDIFISTNSTPLFELSDLQKCDKKEPQAD